MGAHDQMSAGRPIMSLMLAHLTCIGAYLAAFTWTCIDIRLFAIPRILSLSLYFAAPFYLVSQYCWELQNLQSFLKSSEQTQ
jgi:hypothetical protein